MVPRGTGSGGGLAAVRARGIAGSPGLRRSPHRVLGCDRHLIYGGHWQVPVRLDRGRSPTGATAAAGLEPGQRTARVTHPIDPPLRPYARHHRRLNPCHAGSSDQEENMTTVERNRRRHRLPRSNPTADLVGDTVESRSRFTVKRVPADPDRVP